MQNKIARNHIETLPARSPEDLRRAFETAVCELYVADGTANQRVLYRLPIVSRRRIKGDTQCGDEKRALSNAARALAQLWKV
jgi:hypothetical protein